MVITEISIFVLLADVYSINVYIKKSVVKQKKLKMSHKSVIIIINSLSVSLCSNYGLM